MQFRALGWIGIKIKRCFSAPARVTLSAMKALATILFVLLILLQAKLWFGSHGVFQLWSLRTNIQQEQQSNLDLRQRNQQLRAEVTELKQAKEALEERARSQLGFIKEGETFYRVIPKQDQSESE